MRRSPQALAALMVALVLAGCGSGGSTTGAAPAGGTPAATTPTAPAKAAAKQAAASAAEAKPKPPKGASPTLRAIYRQFQKPDRGSMEPEAMDALQAGEAACKGKTPAAVKEEFYGEAKEYLEPEQAKMIGRIASFEARETTDPSFVAGQLAADVYAAALEEEEAEAGYQGCVYVLAQGLERRLAPKEK